MNGTCWAGGDINKSSQDEERLIFLYPDDISQPPSPLDQEPMSQLMLLCERRVGNFLKYVIADTVSEIYAGEDV